MAESEKANTIWGGLVGGTKISDEVYDAKHGTYKDASAELEGHQAPPPCEPSPFTAGGSNPKEK